MEKGLLLTADIFQENIEVAEHSSWEPLADAIQHAHKDCKKQTCHPFSMLLSKAK